MVKAKYNYFHFNDKTAEELANSHPALAPSLAVGPGLHGLCGSPLPEFLEDHPVGEALAADPDALEHPVAAELVQHQVGVQLAGLEERAQARSDRWPL